ncbi:MAG: MFS transporter [Nevskiaceae bacterium]|nr:MAG: MFS transporter [Nevskiaceae bacterium]
MNALEWRATLALGAIYALRMLGVFMILPVFALYAGGLPGHPSAEMIAFALTASGLTQAVCQIPLGRLSDRIGRRPVIALGMVVFALGSFVAGLSDNILVIALGRALQGAGAISSAVTALLADVTREQVRTTAMAVMGAGMGFAFVLALILGPVADGLLGVPGIFHMTALLSLLALPVIWWAAPRPERLARVQSAGGFGGAFSDRELLRLNGGILVLHALVPCVFLAVPALIERQFGWSAPQHWKIYLPVLLGTLLLALPLMRRADQGAARPLLLGAVATLAAGLAVAGFWHGAAGLITGLSLFFLAFNLLEGLLPSRVSRRAAPEAKGAALGVYATAQFIGQPLGGALGGWAMLHYGPNGVLAVAACLPLLWLTFAFGMQTNAPAPSNP